MAESDPVRDVPPYHGFKGVIGRTFSESVPSFEDSSPVPDGAPNVIVVLADDLGFADLGCYGSEIPTPTLDSLAARGVRYRNYHSNPMCSPTRASLLTGLNPHRAGMGIVTSGDAGFPGYRGYLHDNVATAAEIFRHNGYATFAVGKWHLSNEDDPSAGSQKGSWPVQRGFDRYYGFLEGLTNFHQPARLIADNHPIEVDEYPDGYYLTDDLTDQAIAMVESAKLSDPDRPFFMYFAHGAVHAPLMAKDEDIARFEGVYSVGWDEIRQQRFARQKAMGIIPEHSVLPPRNSEELLDVPAWESLSADQQRLFTRYMQVYAAMVSNIDWNLGRLLSVLEDLGELDDTVVVFTSDNGASREGGLDGSTEYYRTVRLAGQGTADDNLQTDLERIDLVGGPRSMAHYPRGWAMASNTPFRMYKQTAFAGGHQVPFILSYPPKVPEFGAVREHYSHVTQVLPTLVELIGLEPVTSRNGQPLKRPNARSLLSDQTTGGHPSHPEQLYESRGHRGFHREGWDAVTLHYPGDAYDDEHWYLFDLEDDPSQHRDLSAEEPARAAELMAAWEQAAWESEVFPLDDGTGMHRVPRYWNRPLEPLWIRAFSPSFEGWRAKGLVSGRSVRIDVELAYEKGDEGVLVSHGDQGGGYLLYVQDGRCRLAYNFHGAMHYLACDILPGTTHVSLQMDAPGEGVWDARILAGDDAESDLLRVPMLSGLSPFEGINVGLDRRSPVSWEVRERFGTYRYTGALAGARFVPGELAPDGAERYLIDRRLTLLRTQ